MSARADTDMEVRAHADHHASLRLWLRLLSTTTRIEDTIRQSLREQFDFTLPRFDLMAQLEREPQGLSMGELSRRMMVTGGNVTGIVDQLERAQLVQRQSQPGDRRAFAVHLTSAGREAFARMAKAHESWVVKLLSPLAVAEQEQLHQLLGSLKTYKPTSPALALTIPTSLASTSIVLSSEETPEPALPCRSATSTATPITSPWRPISPNTFCPASETAWPP